MYSIFTYIWAIYGVNGGKYSIHGAYGIDQLDNINHGLIRSHIYIYIMYLMDIISHDGSMVLLYIYMVTWIPSIYHQYTPFMLAYDMVYHQYNINITSNVSIYNINTTSIYHQYTSTSRIRHGFHFMFSPQKPRFPAQRGLPADFLACCTGDACGKGASGADSVLRIRLHNPGDETW